MSASAALQEQLQPLVFDDPFAWGNAWPADALSLENIPPGSNSSFIPPPFLIVSGREVDRAV